MKGQYSFSEKPAAQGTAREGGQDDGNVIHTSAADGPDITADCWPSTFNPV